MLAYGWIIRLQFHFSPNGHLGSSFYIQGVDETETKNFFLRTGFYFVNKLSLKFLQEIPCANCTLHCKLCSNNVTFRTNYLQTVQRLKR